MRKVAGSAAAILALCVGRRFYEAGEVTARATYDKAIDKKQFKDLLETA